LAVTVDGALAEWAAVTPVALNATTASYVIPITPTLPITDANLSLYCAYSGTNLYLAGSITDNVVISGTGYLDNGDAVRVTIDGKADLLFKFRQDDHEVYLGPNNKSADWAIYPFADTLTASVTGSGWTFEAALPTTSLGCGALTGGKQLLVTWAYLDRDTGTTWQHTIVSAPRSAQIQ